MKKTIIFIMLAILAPVITSLYAQQNSALIALASCKLSKSGKTVSVLKRGNHLEILISSSINLIIQQNDSFLEMKDAQGRICFSEGFEGLGCSATSFSIQQQICTRQSIIQESFTFVERKANEVFYLTRYKRARTNKNATSKQGQSRTYTTRQMGNIEFQNVTRDYLTRLVNK